MGLSARKVTLPEAALMECGRLSSPSVLDQSNYRENRSISVFSRDQLLSLMDALECIQKLMVEIIK